MKSKCTQIFFQYIFPKDFLIWTSVFWKGSEVFSSMRVLLLLGFFLVVVVNLDCSTAKKHNEHRGTKAPCTKHKHKRPLHVITRATPHPSARTEHVTKYKRPSRKVKTPCTRHKHRPRKTPEPTQPILTIHHTTGLLTTACKETNCVLSEWIKWTKCSSMCGNTGVKQRSRKVKYSIIFICLVVNYTLAAVRRCCLFNWFFLV
jgi:hypothetical protein